jgi:hypothetical protein
MKRAILIIRIMGRTGRFLYDCSADQQTRKTGLEDAPASPPDRPPPRIPQPKPAMNLIPIPSDSAERRDAVHHGVLQETVDEGRFDRAQAGQWLIQWTPERIAHAEEQNHLHRIWRETPAGRAFSELNRKPIA